MQQHNEQQAGIKDAWAELVKSRPRLHQKDAADLLGVSEAELVASRCGDGVVRLTCNWREILEGLAQVGTVKTITRNAHAVHETIGRYDQLSFAGPFALIQSEGLDLRLLLPTWHVGFAVSESISSGTRWSLQFYDRLGRSVHKIFLEPEADIGAFLKVISRCADSNQDTRQPLEGNRLDGDKRGHRADGSNGEKAAPADDNGTGVDRSSLLHNWAALRDTHDFAAMLDAHGIDRRSAMEIANGRFAFHIGKDGLRRLLETVSGSDLPIMVFLSNPGAVQIRTGTIQDVRVLGPWLNILDPTFNLHVLEESIESVWVVEKPTTDGTVTSLEAYAHDRSEVVVIYGARKPGVPELEPWRNVVAGLYNRAVPA